MQEHKHWLKYAEDDLLAAKRLINDDYPLIQAGTYHCQQSAEKSLKAYLVYKKHPLIKTHNLILLTRACVIFDTTFHEILPIATSLNPFSVSSRYPDDCFDAPNLDTAQLSIKEAEDILNFVLGRVY